MMGCGFGGTLGDSTTGAVTCEGGTLGAWVWADAAPAIHAQLASTPAAVHATRFDRMIEGFFDSLVIGILKWEGYADGD